MCSAFETQKTRSRWSKKAQTSTMAPREMYCIRTVLQGHKQIGSRFVSMGTVQYTQYWNIDVGCGASDLASNCAHCRSQADAADAARVCASFPAKGTFLRTFEVSPTDCKSARTKCRALSAHRTARSDRACPTRARWTCVKHAKRDSTKMQTPDGRPTLLSQQP